MPVHLPELQLYAYLLIMFAMTSPIPSCTPSPPNAPTAPISAASRLSGRPRSCRSMVENMLPRLKFLSPATDN